MKKQVIFIAGIYTPQKVLNNWKEVLKKKFKGYDIMAIGKNYSYFNLEEIQKVMEEALSLIDNKKETILIGHSFGGIIINSILNQSKKHNVKKIITIASPHKINLFGMKKRKQALNYSKEIDKKIKINTFGAYFDTIVPFFLSSLKNSIHKNIPAGHFKAVLYDKKTIKKILDHSTK